MHHIFLLMVYDHNHLL